MSVMMVCSLFRSWHSDDVWQWCVWLSGSW